MTSSRLPGKMLLKIGGVPLYEFVYRRCQQVRGVDKVVLATSVHSSDTLLVDAALGCNFNVFRGALHNVLERYVACGKRENADIVIRVCGDSPFVDVELVNHLLDLFSSEELDYISVNKNNCTNGLDSEVVSLSALEKILTLTNDPEDYEHVTRHIRQNQHLYKAKIIDADRKLCNGKISLTVDTEDDLRVCNQIAQSLDTETGSRRFDFTSSELSNIAAELL